MDYTTCDDQTLIRLLVYKKPDALSALYDRYGNLVFSVAMAIVSDRGSAEEITQDVFLRVWNNAAMYDQGRTAFKNWLARITRNRAIDVLRRHRTRPEHHAVNWADPSVRNRPDDRSSPYAIELSLEKEQIRSVIAKLPESQQHALHLAYFQGYTHQEIADLLNEPLGTIKTRIRLGIQKLREFLQNS